MADPTREPGIGAKFAGCTVEYIGPGAQHNGVIPLPDRDRPEHMDRQPGVASGRLPKGRPRRVSPMIAAAAAAAARRGEPFLVRDSSGNVIAAP